MEARVGIEPAYTELQAEPVFTKNPLFTIDLYSFPKVRNKAKLEFSGTFKSMSYVCFVAIYFGIYEPLKVAKEAGGMCLLRTLNQN